ncbi:MAG: hypothetical protein LBT55_06445 [Clostridiaceae bacterium]|jgi:hypothetical protein|nr:hypothetical protein [Clostridiaceae bacterium]
MKREKNDKKEAKKTRGNYMFNITKKGYSVPEVEDYIKREKNKTDAAAMEAQKNREILLQENRTLCVEVKNLQKREDEIKTSLLAATEKSNEMMLDLKLQYALEIERLKIFQAKWTNAYEELKERYHFESDVLSMENVVVNTAHELEKLLTSDFGLQRRDNGGDAERQFKSESQRLMEQSPEMKKLVEKLKAEIKTVSARVARAAADPPREPLSEVADEW